MLQMKQILRMAFDKQDKLALECALHAIAKPTFQENKTVTLAKELEDRVEFAMVWGEHASLPC